MSVWKVFNFQNNRLARSLVFLMVLSSSLLSVIATCIQLYSSYQRDSQQLVAETVDSIDGSFRNSLENALWSFNFQQVETLLDGIFAKASIDAIELASSSGHSWRRGENALADSPISHDFDLARRQPGEPRESLGKLNVGLTLEDVRARIWAQFWTLFLSNLGKTFLASLIMLALFHTLVTRHLRQIVQFVNDANWMEREEPLTLDRGKSNDDFECIVSAINAAKSRVLTNLQRLQKSNKELTRSNRELDDFAHIASHDLKEPLRATYNHASFLLEDYEDRLEEDGKRRLVRLVELSQRMERLIAELLYFSRLGRGAEANELIDSKAMLRDIESEQSDLFLERNARLIIGEPLPLVMGHRAHVETVFRNLIVNGIKYNDAKEKIIEIGCVAEGQDRTTDEIGAFYVKDNGIGIEDEFREEVFRIFKRLTSEEAYGSGTGAGLSFAKKIIENHGGAMWFTSVVGEGTTFFFTLPPADAPQANPIDRKAA